MTQEVTAQIDRFYDDVIFLKEDTWLSFHREHYKGHKDVVIISLVDGLLETTTVLATYVDGVWKFPNQRSASLFWKYAKVFDSRMRRIVHKLVVPLPEDMTMRITWRCFQRKVRMQYRLIRRNIKLLFN
jgi:hypothetical protein